MHRRIKRREFITYCSGAAAAAFIYPVLPGCSGKNTLELNEFIKLSSVLTGFSEIELDRNLASAYLNSLQEFPPSDSNLAELYSDLDLKTNKSPQNSSIENIIFNDPKKKLLANTIINYWFSGTYKSKDGMKVSNYQQMYAWKATGYLIPNAQCRGDFGFWQNKPVVT